MKEWNVVLTSHANQERRLLSELAGLGEFQSTGFREVIVGQVPNPSEFLEILLKRWQEQLFLPEMLSTVVPVRVVFPFTLGNLLGLLEDQVKPLALEIGEEPFYVRLKRRGHKGEIASQEVEQVLDRFLKEELDSLGFTPSIDFQNPGVIVVVEIIHNQCGVGLITWDLKARYPFIKVK